MGVYNLSTVDMQRQQIETSREIYRNSGMEEFGAEIIKSTEVMLDNIYIIQGSALAVALACIAGALLMRKLKKNGFYLYLIASIASVAIPISIIGFGLMGGIILASSVFTLAFVIMYAVNLKYMHLVKIIFNKSIQVNSGIVWILVE